MRPFDKQAAAFRQTACVPSTDRLPPLDRRGTNIDHPTCCFTIPRREENARVRVMSRRNFLRGLVRFPSSSETFSSCGPGCVWRRSTVQVIKLTGAVWWYYVGTQERAAFRQTRCTLSTNRLPPSDRLRASLRQTGCRLSTDAARTLITPLVASLYFEGRVPVSELCRDEFSCVDLCVSRAHPKRSVRVALGVFGGGQQFRCSS